MVLFRNFSEIKVSHQPAGSYVQVLWNSDKADTRTARLPCREVHPDLCMWEVAREHMEWTTAAERQGGSYFHIPRASTHGTHPTAHDCPPLKMLALGSQDCALILGPQDLAQGLDRGRCQIRLYGIHEQGAAASYKYVTYKIGLKGWEKYTPFYMDGFPDKILMHMEMFSCDVLCPQCSSLRGLCRESLL